MMETEAQAGALPGFRLPVQIVVGTPDYSQTVCPDCGGPTKRKRSYHIHPQDVNLEQPTVLQVYREVRKCCDPERGKRFVPELDFMEPRGRFTKRAKQKAIASVAEDGVPPERVPRRMWRDFHVRVAKSTVYEWVHAEAEADLGEAEYTQWVVARFSAILTYRRGLPRETEAQKAIRKELWDYRYLLLKANHKLSDRERKRLEMILDTHKGTVLPEAYQCKEALLALFRESEDKDDARARRGAILERFGGVPELKKVLDVIRGDDFEQMIVYLDYENLDKTNNNAERVNRVYQKGEKVRYRARKTRTRLNYVRLRARQRNQRSAERNDHLRRRKKRRAAFAGRVDAVVEREARRLAA